MQNHQITNTLYAHLYATSARPAAMSWEEWCEDIQKYCDKTYVQKENLLVMIPAIIAKGERRLQKNVSGITGFCFDIERDKEKHSLEEYLSAIQVAIDAISKWHFCMWTTYKHKPEEPRFRVWLPFKDPVSVELNSYNKIKGYFNYLTENIADLNAQKIGQPAYLPGHHPKDPPGQFVKNDGNAGFFDYHSKDIQEILRMRRLLGAEKGTAPNEGTTREACKFLYEGKAFAKEGNRDTMATNITFRLASDGYRFSDKNIEFIFEKSLSKMGVDAPSIENIIDKFERALENHFSDVNNDDILDLRPSEVSLELPRVVPNIVQLGKQYYFYEHEKRHYTRGVIETEFSRFVKTVLRKNPGVDLFYETEKGRKKLTPEQIKDTFVEPADEVIQDTSLDLPFYREKDRTLFLPTLKRPKITPKKDELLEEWLRMLTTNRFEEFKDWLSIYPDLTRLLSCLIILGKPGIGKTLLGSGLAKVFGDEAPADQDTLVGNWNTKLLKCPLIYIDENVDENPYKKSFMATIRSELSIRARTLRTRFKTETTLKGAIRCVITANHIPFKSNQVATADDVAAIAERFFWVKSDPGTADFLQQIPQKIKTRWANEGIPAYVEYLRQERKVEDKYRFGVQGDPRLADIINISSRWNSYIIEWIVNGVMDGFDKLEKNRNDERYGAIIYKNKVYVRVKTIVSAWDKYLTNTKAEAETRPVAKATKALALGEARRLSEIGLESEAVNDRMKYYEISENTMSAFIEDTAVWSHEELKDALARPTKIPVTSDNVTYLTEEYKKQNGVED